MNLPKRTLDYKTTPRLVASLQGQSGAEDKSGFSVPIAITGPWANPSILPDMAALLRDGALDKAKGVIGGGAGGIGDALKGITGGGSSTAPAPSGTKPSSGLPNPANAIKGLFGK